MSELSRNFGMKERGRESHGRIINQRRIKQVYICATQQRIRDAIPGFTSNLPLTDVTIINNPVRMEQRLSEEHSVLVVDDTGIQFLERDVFRKNNPLTETVFLSCNQAVGKSPPHVAARMYPYVSRADMVFYLDEKADATALLTAAVRCARDKMSIIAGPAAKRFIYLIVEDEPRWYSEFLPVLYDIVGQRAAMLIARTYEEADAALNRYGDNIICLMTDIMIPKENSMGNNGRLLVQRTKTDYQRIPVIVASTAEAAEELRSVAFILKQGQEHDVLELKKYLERFTGLGGFYFFDKHGRFIGHANDIWELGIEIAKLPTEILEEYAQRDYFSTWAYMHGYDGLGDQLRPRSNRGGELRQMLLAMIHEEIGNIEKAVLQFIDEAGVVITEVSSLEELLEAIATIDSDTLEFYAERDGFSTWLMKKGYHDLANILRPVFGRGEELRENLSMVIKGWMERNPASL